MEREPSRKRARVLVQVIHVFGRSEVYVPTPATVKKEPTNQPTNQPPTNHTTNSIPFYKIGMDKVTDIWLEDDGERLKCMKRLATSKCRYEHFANKYVGARKVTVQLFYFKMLLK